MKKMARRHKNAISTHRSNRKVLDAFQIAEREENMSSSGIESENDENTETKVRGGVMMANKFLSDEAKSTEEFEDEEIDSDEALGSEDEYDVLNSKFSQTIRDKKKRRTLARKTKQRGEGLSGGQGSESESEFDEGYSSIDEGQLVTLSQALDMDERERKQMETSGDKNDVVLDDHWETESSQESSAESESDDEAIEELPSSEEEDVLREYSDDEEEPELLSTVSKINASLKKAPKEKKRLIADARDDSEHMLPANGNDLSLQEMLGAVSDPIAKQAILIDTNPEKKSMTLDTPLPKRIQQRHERKAAYEITKEEVSKWEDTVQQNRRAEVLKFPMNAEVKHNDVSTTMRGDMENMNELETKIHAVLEKSALLDDRKEATFEQIAAAKLSPEDLRKRTKELRLMRELMFRDEKRAKRIKKIKSKTYHRIKKKERARNKQLVDGSDQESDTEEQNIKRIQERMSLKHKTQSRWAQSLIKSGLSKDASNRAELEEMLQQGEKLRAKQLGFEDGDQSDEGISDLEKDYDNDGAMKEEEEIAKQKLGKGVLGMDFMKAAEEQQKQQNLKDLEDLRTLEYDQASGDLVDNRTSVSVTKNQGRRVYTPGLTQIAEEMKDINEKLSQEIEDDRSNSLESKLHKGFDRKNNELKRSQGAKLLSKIDSVKENDKNNSNRNDPDAANPWLDDSSSKPIKKSGKINVIGQNSSAFEKASHKISKNKKRNASKKDIDEAIINLSSSINVGNVHDSEDEGLDENMNNSDIHVFKQQDMIKQAFAGDDVVNEFEIEKKRVVREEGDKIVDETLPGWGDWTGGGKKTKKRKFRKVDGVVQKDKRKDKNLKNVIINERVNKKNLKYQSSAVPFPYESREQYERSLRMPIGQEWTSKESHQRLTMPRVVTKQGRVIDPLKAPFK